MTSTIVRVGGTRSRRPVRRRPLRRAGRGSSGFDPKAMAVVGLGALLLAAAPAVSAVKPAAPSPAQAVKFQGASKTCSVKDPTTAGCLTPATAHGVSELVRVFGPLHAGPTFRSASCWDAHTWNPTSDHPKGKACDLFPDRAGIFPTGAPLDRGWAVAKWLRTNADALRVRYVIWQGRIWQADLNTDSGGWGRKYTGGGIYDVADATGGHYDHVHVSFQN